jgi:hypothetical protein
MINNRKNRLGDLIWIIPEIAGELFLYAYIPLKLLAEITNVGIKSPLFLVYVGVGYLLIKHLRFEGFNQLVEIFKK